MRYSSRGEDPWFRFRRTCQRDRSLEIAGECPCHLWSSPQGGPYVPKGSWGLSASQSCGRVHKCGSLGSPTGVLQGSRGSCHSQKAVGIFNIEGFGAVGKVVQHPRASKASRNVGHDVLRDLDTKAGIVVCDVDFGQGSVHLILEVFELVVVGAGQTFHKVPRVRVQEFGGRIDPFWISSPPPWISSAIRLDPGRRRIDQYRHPVDEPQ